VNVLAVGAHPDDVELLCAGTLALYRKEGHEVYVAVATDGGAGSSTLSWGEISTVRLREAEAACGVIGARFIWMGFPDQRLFDTPEVRTRFIDAIREARPKVMFVHDRGDYHPDHRTAGKVAEDARVPSSVRLVQTGLPAVLEPPHVFVMDTIGGLGFRPDLYVDVTETFEAKQAMLLAHESQAAHLREAFGMDYAEFMRSHARQRGIEAGCLFAEGFREIRTFPATGGPSLLPGARAAENAGPAR
jgi:LmbE family N-acetylglucosaminyl deacetylase